MTQETLFAKRILAPIGAVAETLSRHKCRQLSGFLAAQGGQYRGCLMVVGRAPNGWEVSAYLEKFATCAGREEFTQQVQKSVDGPDPMAWVQKQWGATDCYNTQRSAFWRVIRRVTQCLCSTGGNGEDWPSHLVWSNLYKVSPAAGGNPGNGLRKIQFPGCKELFQLELETYRPKRLLLLTGWDDWAERFLDQLAPDDVAGMAYVERVGTIVLGQEHQIRVVVAYHPQGRPEETWSGEVLEAFGLG